MAGLLITGVATFAATNIDDILIVIAFFAQVDASFRPRHVVVGQYLGFSFLIAVSLIGFFSSLLIPRPWVGLLGLLPIGIGVHRLWKLRAAEATAAENDISLTSKPTLLNTLFSPYSYQVAAVTVANGGDNIGIYGPLFSNSTAAELGIILGLFFILVGVLCFASYRLICQPGVAAVLLRYGHIVLPFVLIGLGIIILLESDTASLFGQ